MAAVDLDTLLAMATAAPATAPPPPRAGTTELDLLEAMLEDEAAPPSAVDPTVFREGDPALVQRFLAYHAANPGIYAEFRSRARRMRARGRERYSQWTIIQSIRWDFDLRTTGDVFKINNDFIALYVRLLIHQDPSFDGFFELRAMKPSRRRKSEEQVQREGGSDAEY